LSEALGNRQAFNYPAGEPHQIAEKREAYEPAADGLLAASLSSSRSIPSRRAGVGHSVVSFSIGVARE
jgi:hypothetical protein